MIYIYSKSYFESWGNIALIEAVMENSQHWSFNI